MPGPTWIPSEGLTVAMLRYPMESPARMPSSAPLTAATKKNNSRAIRGSHSIANDPSERVTGCAALDISLQRPNVWPHFQHRRAVGESDGGPLPDALDCTSHILSTAPTRHLSSTPSSNPARPLTAPPTTTPPAHPSPASSGAW
eukprot:CAMPEP_0194299486 /NCGR_PEP_ID=MMETSP0169-20130528/60744_1 /TAXON_ID=218684 /ORGANISM="Corethron pennatum, Strain L29A3" /LENGTH=143 /DNA_ID=CAMNT_0039049583 /DNA_START=691 /DNA_END=1119 /DNA_ORIENTATION=+